MIKACPVIGIPVDVRLLDDAPYHIVGKKYHNAIVHGADGYPVILPAMGGSALEHHHSGY